MKFDKMQAAGGIHAEGGRGVLSQEVKISKENQIELSRLGCTTCPNYIVNSIKITNVDRITDSALSDFLQRSLLILWVAFDPLVEGLAPACSNY